MPAHTHCRICKTPLPAPFLDLGEMPLANAFLTSPDQFASEPRYPLAVAGCVDCGLVQLTYVVPAEELFRDYIYVSSTSEGVSRHAEHLADSLIAQYGWGASSLIVEIASNDGTVLKSFKKRGVKVLGVEPARNIAAIANAAGIPTLPEFFNRESARAVLDGHGLVSGIFGRHVFAHVDDVHEFVDGVNLCLAPDGVFLIEVPYLGDFLEHLEFDTVYHEHLSYVSLGAMQRLCREHDLDLVDAEQVALHGGSVIIHMRRAGTAKPTARLTALLERERQSKMTDPARLKKFAADVAEWRGAFEGMIRDLRRRGATMIGYGAAAKGNTLLNYCASEAKALKYILDRSAHKQGKYTPGTHIPVEKVDHWTTGEQPSHMVILAWNFKDEIMAQMKPFADRGGKFVIPIPKPIIL